MVHITDWLGTLRQALPQIGPIVRHMRPSLEVPDVASIDPELLESIGVTAVIWDVDGTLMPRHGREVAAPFQQAFRVALATPGMRHLILSNADEARYRELGSIFPDIPVVRAYETRHGLVGRTLYHGTDSWDTIEDLDLSGARALRKPCVALIDLALEQLGHPPKDSVLMVGDQYITDIAGANLAGIRSLKVRTHAPTSFPVPVRLLQYLEQLGYRVFHGRRGPHSFRP